MLELEGFSVTVRGWDRNGHFDTLVATIEARRKDTDRWRAIPVVVPDADYRLAGADFAKAVWAVAWSKLTKALIEEDGWTPADCETLRPEMPPLPTGDKP